MRNSFRGIRKGFRKEDLASLKIFDVINESVDNNASIFQAIYNRKSDDEDICTFVFNKDDIIDSIEVVSKPIELSQLKEVFTLKRNSLKKDYNDCRTYPEDYIQRTDEEIEKCVDTGCISCIWDSEETTNFPSAFECIYLKLKKNYGDFVWVIKCKFSNDTEIPYEDKITDEDFSDDIETDSEEMDEDISSEDKTNTQEIQITDEDLLDDEETVYENSDSEDDVQQELSEEPESEEIQDDIPSKEKTNTEESSKKRVPIFAFFENGIKFVGCLVVFLILWFWFLYQPIGKMFEDFSVISFVYYCIYFGYTVLACVVPILISNRFVEFKENVEHDKQYLIDDNVELTEDTKTIWQAYRATFFDKNFGIKDKTRANADLYFNYESVIGTMSKHPIIPHFKIIASSFLGLGILGTFIGFSIGFNKIDFHTESSTEIMDGIELLVKNGLSTAFNTSIVGVLFSLIYNFFIYNPLIKEVNDYFKDLSDELDKEFYISETEALMQYTMVTGENSETVTFSQSLRFIVENMNKQTDALNNFNDNLADKIANMKQSVDTAMERIATDVGGELKNVVIENVHKEMGSLKTSLADAAKELSLAADKFSNTPELIEKANEELRTYLEDTRTSFTEMLAENEKTNKAILDDVVKTVKEELTNQFKDFGKSLEKALNSAQKAANMLSETPELIENIENALIEKESEVAVKFDNASSKLSDITEGITDYLTTMQNGIASVLDDLSNAEENVKELLASAKMHEDNSGRNLTSVIEETNRMLEGFKDVDINLKNIFESIGNEIVKYNTTVESTLDQYLESFEKGSKSFSNSVTGSMQDFESAIDSLTTNMLDVQKTSNQFGESVIELGDILNRKETTNKDKK